MEWMILPLKRYGEMSGRSRRKEYWMFTLFNVLVALATTAVDHLLGFDWEAAGPTNIIASLALFVPGITVWVRRLHDTDRSAAWVLFIFLPIIGWIILFALACMEGTQGPNRYATIRRIRPATCHRSSADRGRVAFAGQARLCDRRRGRGGTGRRAGLKIGLYLRKVGNYPAKPMV